MTNENTAIKITAMISGVILIIAIATLYVFNSAIHPEGNTINVEGIATVKAMPDLISVYFNIQTKGETTQEAKDANSEIFDDLVLELLSQGFERKDIVTENFNIYPDYEWKDGTRTENGFIATHSIRIEIDAEETDKLGSIIDAGADSGAGISYINFELSQELQNTYKAEAMKLAAQDARVKAEAVAEGFDKSVGKLVSTSVSDFGYYPWNVFSARTEGVGEDYALAKETVSSIQPGDKEITSRINAVFKLN
ncbi:MAG: SIMPL domain-containing protein [Nanoarchaeota archaeon]|nr:SIMPL domain-containing protein [Nanoarchaeota archaeon]